MLSPFRAALAVLSFLALVPQSNLLAQRTDSAQLEYQHVISHFPDDPATDAFGLRRSRR